MARERIAMSEEEVRAFLHSQRWVVLGTLDPRGAPEADLALCGLTDATLYFGVERDGRSARHIAQDARVCCAIDQFPTYYEIKGVTVHGRARPITDADEITRVRTLMGDTADRVIYALPLDDVVSFDFAKIQQRV